MPSLAALQRLKGEQALDKQLAGFPVSESFRARVAEDLSGQIAGIAAAITHNSCVHSYPFMV